MTISRMQNQQQLQGIGSLRQPYGLGKLVKKAFKGIKKIAKSPIGKAAIIGGLGMIPFGATGATGWGRLGGMLKGMGGTKLGGMFSGGAGKLGGGLGNWWGGLSGGQKIFTGLAGTAIAAPFVQKALKWGPYQDDEEEEQVDWSTTPGSISNIRNMAKNQDPSLAFLPKSEYTNWYAADGGRAGLLNGGGAGEAQMEQMLRAEYLKYKNKGGTMPYEQFKILVMKQAQQGQMPNQMMAANGGRIGAEEGGLMDMGGQEKDYREEGGFVPIGGEERADDVPARLSKNEFVFTADAVRAAGGGDIDAGSEVMQNVMDNLEQGGEVSEDSQGLAGGEEIMSEEIIDESNPAQGMYDNYEQLQSRVA